MSERAQKTLTILVGGWIAVAMLFYTVRFSLALYRTHQADFEAVLALVSALFGGG
jgi:hypothetical protein